MKSASSSRQAPSSAASSSRGLQVSFATASSTSENHHQQDDQDLSADDAELLDLLEDGENLSHDRSHERVAEETDQV